MSIIEIVKKHPAVARVNIWGTRHYVTLANVNDSWGADVRTRIWVQGDVLTIEKGKGYNSDAWIADKHALVDAVKAAGGTIREI